MVKARTLFGRLLGRALPRYEAASSAPRLSNVTTGSLRASEAARQTKPLSERASHYSANNPWIAAGVESLVAALVGSGIKPRPQHPDPALRALLAREWERWADEADACESVSNLIVYKQGTAMVPGRKQKPPPGANQRGPESG